METLVEILGTLTAIVFCIFVYYLVWRLTKRLIRYAVDYYFEKKMEHDKIMRS